MTSTPPTPLPTPSLSKRKGEADDDLTRMLELWNCDSTDRDISRAMALEIADRNRENARSEK